MCCTISERQSYGFVYFNPNWFSFPLLSQFKPKVSSESKALRVLVAMIKMVAFLDLRLPTFNKTGGELLATGIGDS